MRLTGRGLPDGDRLLLRICLRMPGWGVLLLAGTCATTAASLLSPALLAAAANAVIGHADAAPATVRLALALALGAAGSLAADLAGPAILARNSAWLGRRLIRQAVALGLRGQASFAPGDMTSRLLDNVPAACAAGASAVNVALGLVTSLGAVTALGLTDWHLAVVFGVCAVPLALAIRSSMRGVSAVFGDYQRAQASIASGLTQALSGIRTIASSGTAGVESARILRPLPELAAAGRRTWNLQRRVAWRFALGLALTELAVLGTAGADVAAGRLSAGAWLAAAAYTTLALGTFGSIDALMGIAHARAAAARVAEVLGVPRPAVSRRGLDTVTGRLAFREVTAYPLDRVSLDVPAGSTVAIVGRSGSGKTTLAALAGRLMEPDDGVVLLEGIPVWSIAPADLHRAVAYAFAQPACLGRTVADDIGYGSGPIPRSRIERAARVAHADEFIRRLPRGYDTPTAGLCLSGGERQRLGIARAVAARARVLVLDDATSSLDTATEARVNDALRASQAGRTTLVIAHRAATAGRADAVVWLDGGRVRRIAPHRELWSDPGYRAVFCEEP